MRASCTLSCPRGTRLACFVGIYPRTILREPNRYRYPSPRATAPIEDESSGRRILIERRRDTFCRENTCSLHSFSFSSIRTRSVIDYSFHQSVFSSSRTIQCRFCLEYELVGGSFFFFFFLFFLRRRRLTLVTCNPSGAECYFALLTALMESMVDPITDVDGLDLTSRSRVADSLES